MHDVGHVTTLKHQAESSRRTKQITTGHLMNPASTVYIFKKELKTVFLSGIMETQLVDPRAVRAASSFTATSVCRPVCLNTGELLAGQRPQRAPVKWANH